MLNLLGWCGLSVLLVWSLKSSRSIAPSDKTPGWSWWALSAAVLLCFRWRMVSVPTEFNEDEAQLIAGALTLKHDPIFWRSVDGITAGPLTFFPLLPATFAVGPASFMIARLIALAGSFATLVFAGKTIALLAGPAVGRAAVLPALAFLAFTTTPDLLFYSTETAPVFLLAAAAFLIARQMVQPHRAHLWLGGLLLGAVPWAKLQATPIAATLWLLLLVLEWTSGRRRSLIVLFGAGLIPSLVIAMLATAFNETNNLLISYIFNNIGYVQAGAWTWENILALQLSNTIFDGFLAWWIAGIIGFALLTSATAREPSRIRVGFSRGATLLLLAAVACVIAPRRDYPHYLHLLELPLVLMGGVVLTGVWRAELTAANGRTNRLALALFLAVSVGPQLGLKLLHPDARYAELLWQPTPSRTQLSSIVSDHASRGEALAIWGWYSAVYVDTGMYQATREGQTQPQINPGRWQGYFLQRYLNDFVASDAPVFVDTIGPGTLGKQFSDRKVAHESFPPLRSLIAERYTLAKEIGGARVYVRNDRLRQVQLP